MLRILSNTVFSLIIVGSLLCMSLILSIKFDNFNILASSGGFMVVIGIILAVKHELLFYEKDIISAMHRKFPSVIFGPEENDPEYLRRIEKTKEIIRDEKIGLYMSIIGTLIWAYGGFLQNQPC